MNNVIRPTFRKFEGIVTHEARGLGGGCDELCRDGARERFVRQAKQYVLGVFS